MNRSFYVALPLMVALTVLQVSVWPRFLRLSMVPQFVLLAPIAWALLRGTYEGMLWAFLAGLFLDLFSYAPLGATSLALMASVLVIGWLQQVLPENRFLLPVLFTVIALAVYYVFYLLILRLAGLPFSWQTVTSLPTVLFLHAFLVIPVYWLLYYMERLLNPRHLAA